MSRSKLIMDNVILYYIAHITLVTKSVTH